MNQLPPELFSQRPVRSEWGRAPSYRTRRIITITVCVLLIAGILYRAFSWTSPKPGEIPTIKAESGAWKQRPEQPGGIDIPHQDVQVYQELDGKDAAKPAVEHLLPPPEVPQAATAPAPSAPSVPPPATEAEPLMPPKIETTVTDVPPAAPAPVPAAAAAAPVETQPAQQPAPAAAPVASKSAPAKAKPPTVTQVQKTVSGKGGHAVQLASMQDESAAKAMMQKLQTRYAATLGDVRLHLVRADLGAKGVYYRIRSEVLPEDKAHEICASLVKAKAGCILVH